MAPGEGGGADRISGLPDELLHRILLLIPGGTAADAARTSVLSRRCLLLRYRRSIEVSRYRIRIGYGYGTSVKYPCNIGAHLPELALCYDDSREPPSLHDARRAHERADAALAVYSAPTVRRLEIVMPFGSRHVTGERVSSWLRFASRRLVSELKLSLPHPALAPDKGEEAVLPACERATAIDVESVGRALPFRLLPLTPPSFAALASLRITEARLDARELEHVLSSRCPRLKELVLEWVSFSPMRDDDGDAAAVLSIRSASLQRLQMASSEEFAGSLRIAAPELRVLAQRCFSCHDAYIAAPKLSEVYWHTLLYDPSRHRFAEAGRHLRRMEVTTGSPTMALMNRFDVVDELKLTISAPQGVHQYEKLLEDTNKLAKCAVLVLKFVELKHDFKPIMVHLLQQCAGARKLVVEFPFKMMDDYPCKSSGCPCNQLENSKTNRIVLHSLEEVEVKGGGEGDHKAELVRILCKYHATFKKKVFISVRGGAHTQRKIGNFVPPNDKYEITV
ncbi:unnamed protein product [Urochloa decumbens]|uniref:F-box domain-containing protein n=1 Tax=Urochloa decumbens TaxID=240449 RepID=A0ABC9GRU9_9POAL